MNFAILQVTLVDRVSDDDFWTFEICEKYPGKDCSYDYLGFAESYDDCTNEAIEAVRQHGLAYCSQELGISGIHQEMESTVAEFLGVDELKHTPIILGLRFSGAIVAVFKHNNVDLEKVLRSNIVKGHPRFGKAWTKVFIAVEGVYSMEGLIVRPPEIIAIKHTQSEFYDYSII